MTAGRGRKVEVGLGLGVGVYKLGGVALLDLREMSRVKGSGSKVQSNSTLKYK